MLKGEAVRGPVSARINIGGREYLNFYGSGYLALSKLPETRSAVARALAEDAVFSRQIPASMGGADAYFDRAEQTGAEALGTEAAVFLPTGYFVGPIGLASLGGACDRLFLDESAHYNLRDAATLSGLPSHTFAHLDAQQLHEGLKRHVRPGERPMVMSDGVFASTGAVAPLGAYAEALDRYDGHLLVDESHAFGVLGANGRGAAEHCGVDQIATIGTTLSKAVCAHGALVGCHPEARARIQLHPFVRGACSGSPLSAAAAVSNLEYIRRHPEIRQELRGRTAYFRARLREVGLDVLESPAPIVAFSCGSAEDMRALQRRFFEEGVLIYHSTYIGSGVEGVIRCAVFRDHTNDDIDAFVQSLDMKMRGQR